MEKKREEMINDVKEKREETVGDVEKRRWYDT